MNCGQYIRNQYRTRHCAMNRLHNYTTFCTTIITGIHFWNYSSLDKISKIEELDEIRITHCLKSIF